MQIRLSEKLHYGVYFLTPLLALLLKNGALIACPILAVFSIDWRKGYNLKISQPIILCVIAFFLWGLITTFWSPLPLHSIKSLTVFLLLTLLTLLSINHYSSEVTPDHMRMIGYGVMLACALGIGFYIMKVSVFYSHLQVLTALLLWPIHFVLKEKSIRPTLYLWGIACLFIFITGSHTARWAFFISLLLVGVLHLINYHRHIRTIRFTIATLCAALVMSFPFLPFATLKEQTYPYLAEKFSYKIIKSSLYHRLIIYDKVGQEIAEHPVTGHGLHTGRDQYMKKMTRYYAHQLKPGNNTQITIDTAYDAVAMHPHNFGLQIWLELGGIGIVLCLTALYILFHHFRHFPPRRQLFMIGNFITFFVISQASYGVWHSWWLATLCINCLVWAGVHKEIPT